MRPGRPEPMRYGPAENLFRLARSLAATRTGLTLDEMASGLGVGRRTAERLRDTLQAMFAELDYREDEARVRRWRLPGSALVGVVEPSAEAVAAVEVAAREFEQRGEAHRAALLEQAATALRAVMRPGALARAESDIAALMEAEGIATRPGPRLMLPAETLAALRHAILGMRVAAVRYRGAEQGAATARLLCAYGILHGGRGWLVAQAEGAAEMRLWRLDRIASVQVLDRGFDRDEGFSLAEYATRSFGVFQEPALDVVLRFAPVAAGDAERWSFHPTQLVEWEGDGSLLVRFRAGGIQEMCHHLFAWGETVEIVEPEELRKHLARLSEVCSQHHGKHTRLNEAVIDGSNISRSSLSEQPQIHHSPA